MIQPNLDQVIANYSLSITQKYVDYLNISLMPAICLFGIVTNSLNLIVLTRKELRENHLLRNYLLISMSEFCLCLVEFPIFVFRCNSLCSYAYSYGAKFYEIYIFLFVGYSFACFSVLIDITIAFSRLLMFYPNFKCTTCLQTDSHFTLKALVCFLISLALNIPENAIGKMPTVDISLHKFVFYKIAFRDDYKHLKNNLFLVFLLIKGPLTFMTITVLNFKIYLKFRRELSKRDPITVQESQRRARENRMTLMIVIMCSIYILGNLLDTVNLVLFFFDVQIYAEWAVMVVLGNTFYFLSHGVSFFILYAFNRLFRRTLKRMITSNLRNVLRCLREMLNGVCRQMIVDENGERVENDTEGTVDPIASRRKSTTKFSTRL